MEAFTTRTNKNIALGDEGTNLNDINNYIYKNNNITFKIPNEENVAIFNFGGISDYFIDDNLCLPIEIENSSKETQLKINSGLGEETTLIFNITADEDNISNRFPSFYVSALDSNKWVDTIAYYNYTSEFRSFWIILDLSYNKNNYYFTYSFRSFSNEGKLINSASNKLNINYGSDYNPSIYNNNYPTYIIDFYAVLNNSFKLKNFFLYRCSLSNDEIHDLIKRKYIYEKKDNKLYCSMLNERSTIYSNITFYKDGTLFLPGELIESNDDFNINKNGNIKVKEIIEY